MDALSKDPIEKEVKVNSSSITITIQNDPIFTKTAFKNSEEYSSCNYTKESLIDVAPKTYRSTSEISSDSGFNLRAKVITSSTGFKTKLLKLFSNSAKSSVIGPSNFKILPSQVGLSASESDELKISGNCLSTQDQSIKENQKSPASTDSDTIRQIPVPASKSPLQRTSTFELPVNTKESSTHNIASEIEKGCQFSGAEPITNANSGFPAFNFGSESKLLETTKKTKLDKLPVGALTVANDEKSVPGIATLAEETSRASAPIVFKGFSIEAPKPITTVSGDLSCAVSSASSSGKLVFGKDFTIVLKDSPSEKLSSTIFGEQLLGQQTVSSFDKQFEDVGVSQIEKKITIVPSRSTFGELTTISKASLYKSSQTGTTSNSLFDIKASITAGTGFRASAITSKRDFGFGSSSTTAAKKNFKSLSFNAVSDSIKSRFAVRPTFSNFIASSTSKFASSNAVGDGNVFSGFGSTTQTLSPSQVQRNQSQATNSMMERLNKNTNKRKDLKRYRKRKASCSDEVDQMKITLLKEQIRCMQEEHKKNLEILDLELQIKRAKFTLYNLKQI